MVRQLLSEYAGRWPRLSEALLHQHDHDVVVERAIASVFGERYRVTVRGCRCGDQVQTVERAEHELRVRARAAAATFQIDESLRRAG